MRMVIQVLAPLLLGSVSGKAAEGEDPCARVGDKGVIPSCWSQSGSDLAVVAFSVNLFISNLGQYMFRLYIYLFYLFGRQR